MHAFFCPSTGSIEPVVVVLSIMDRQLAIGQLLALLTAACWAQNSVTYRYLGKQVGSGAVAHVRMWIAVPAVMVFSYIAEGSFFPLSLSPTTYLALLLSGVIGFFLTDLLLFKAYVWLGARESLVIMTLSPVVTAILGFFLFSERLNLLQVTGIMLTIGGVVLMIAPEIRGKDRGKEQEQRAKGFVLAVVASVLQAVSLIIARNFLDIAGPVSSNLLRNVGGLLAFIVFDGFVRKDLRQQCKAFADPKRFGLLFLAALIGPVLGMSSQLEAFTYAPVGIVTTISQVSPILLIPVDRFVFHRHLTVSGILGTFVSIGGVSLLFLAA
jgi:drug/metabolite transporter (DMT)-like permease